MHRFLFFLHESIEGNERMSVVVHLELAHEGLDAGGLGLELLLLLQ